MFKLAIDIELLIARRDPLRIGHHPHLDEVHIFAGMRVHLRMPNARPGAHALGQTRVDDAVIAFRVLMFQLAVQHPGHDFHVPMRMGAEAAAGLHPIVVAHQQQSMMGVRRIIVVRKTEAVPRIEPPDLRVKPITGATDVDRRGRVVSRLHDQASFLDSSAMIMRTSLSPRRNNVNGVR